MCIRDSLAPKLLGISVVDAAVMGTVVGAVSPAVIVPKMLNLVENGYGKDKSIPQLIPVSYTHLHIGEVMRRARCYNVFTVLLS